MAFNKASYKSTIKAAFLSAKNVDDPADFDNAMDALAGSIADALQTAISQLEASAGDVTVPGAGLVAPSGGGPVTGSASTALIAPGKIK